MVNPCKSNLIFKICEPSISIIYQLLFMIKILLIMLVAAVMSDDLGYDQHKAKLLFTLSIATACPKAIQSGTAWAFTQLEDAQIEKVHVVDDGKIDLMFYFAKVRKTGIDQPIIALIFRGSLNIDQSLCTNWLQVNLNVDQVPLQFSQGVVVGQNEGVLVHQGFRDAYNKIRDNVYNAYLTFTQGEDPHQLWITGHSLGAALATLATVDFKIIRGIPINQFYTTGAPRVGNKKFAAYFNEQLPNKFRIVRPLDPVTVLPFDNTLAFLVGCFNEFKHSGKIAYYESALGDPYKVCKDSYLGINPCVTDQYNQLAKQLDISIAIGDFVPDLSKLPALMENHLEYFGLNFRTEACICLRNAGQQIPPKCEGFFPDDSSSEL